MDKTSIEISFGLVDVEAKQDTSGVVSEKQDFIDLGDLKLDGVYAPKVATLETDYWKLDGTFSAFPDNPSDVTWGYWSKSQSNEYGLFQDPIVLTLSFQKLHESIGLTFEFNPYDNSFCNDLNIRWYNGTTLLYDLDFSPDNWRYACMKTVENYNKIVITFYGLNKVHRYLKVQNIAHGVIEEFSNSEIISASLIEETDLTGTTLSVNELDFTLHGKDDEFNIFNPQGIYTLLQKKQQLIATGYIGESMINFGTFFVEELGNPSDRTFSISATDSIGIMDGTFFMGGIYKNKPAYELIEEIMEDAGFGYVLDNNIRATVITGYIPICTHRTALRDVVFAIGGFVTTSRSGTVNIVEIPDISQTPTNIIGRDRKILGTSVKLREFVTGVDVKEHNYVLDSSTEEISRVNLDMGDNKVVFSEPVGNLSVSLGSIVKSNVNHCVIRSTVTGECIISGRKYKDSEKIVSARLSDIPAGEKENIFEIDCTLINPNNSLTIATRLLSIYQYRVEQNLTFILGEEVVGTLADIETEYGIYRGSIVESMDIDLTGGLVAKAVVVGE